jgi:hypothetical protein
MKMDWVAIALTAGAIVLVIIFVWFEEWIFIPRGWTWLRLGGNAHVIPRRCPNCMNPGDVPFRVGFVGLLYRFVLPWGGSYQTFYYCPGCAESAQAHIRYRRVLGFLTYLLTGFLPVYLPLIIAAYFVAVVPATAIRHALPDSWGAAVAIPGGILLALLVFVAGIKILASFLKGLMMGRHPKREGQAVQGLAAYYLGGGRYWAARRDWIRALAEANAEQFDPATFEKSFGIPHPNPGPKARPFR